MEAIIYSVIVVSIVTIVIIYSRWESRHATRSSKKYIIKK